jgi:predicted restriction endonuclease
MIKGGHISETTKKRMSISHKGKHLSEETKNKMRLSHIGKKMSLLSKIKLSNSKKGKPNGLEGKKYSIEHRLNISKSLKGKSWKDLGRKEMSNKTKKKISQSRKNKNLTEEVKEKIRLHHARPNLGKKFSKEVRMNMRTGALKRFANMVRITPINESIRKSLKYKLWREKVFERNNYTCKLCLKRGDQIIHAHHILPFSEFKEFRFDIKNGITLCKKCHKLTFGNEWKYIPRFMNI